MMNIVKKNISLAVHSVKEISQIIKLGIKDSI